MCYEQYRGMHRAKLRQGPAVRQETVINNKIIPRECGRGEETGLDINLRKVTVNRWGCPIGLCHEYQTIILCRECCCFVVKRLVVVCNLLSFLIGGMNMKPPIISGISNINALHNNCNHIGRPRHTTRASKTCRWAQTILRTTRKTQAKLYPIWIVQRNNLRENKTEYWITNTKLLLIRTSTSVIKTRHVAFWKYAPTLQIENVTINIVFQIDTPSQQFTGK